MALRFAIVGSGPAGFFTAKSLLKRFPNCKVDMIEKLPVPFGLIRYGVAPDHSEIKSVTHDFSALANSPNFRFFGDVSVGTDVSYKSLSDLYSAVVYAYGSASGDKLLEVPGGEHTKSARSVVEWYNSMPNSEKLSLNTVKKVSIIGNGNVAIDLTRILASPLSRLEGTDIDLDAFEEIQKNRVEEIDVIGRRGPVQAAMTVKELRLLSKLEGISIRVFQDEIDRGLNSNSLEEAQIESVSINQAQRARKRLYELINSFPRKHNENAKVKINFRFLLDPYEFVPPRFSFKETVLEGPVNQQKAVSTDKIVKIDSDLVIRSIGYKSEKIDKDLPFDEKLGVVENIGGKIEKNCFVAGWARTGPFGIIDTTMRSVFYTIDSIVEDFDKQLFVEKKSDLKDLLQKKYVDFSMWEKIDKFEVSEGVKMGKSRVKVKDINKMREIAFS